MALLTSEGLATAMTVQMKVLVKGVGE